MLINYIVIELFKVNEYEVYKKTLMSHIIKITIYELDSILSIIFINSSFVKYLIGIISSMAFTTHLNDALLQKFILEIYT